MGRQTVLVLNSKGGCGKSTIAVNLASYYAARGLRPVLMDYDPQGSALQWLGLRQGHYPQIHGINATRTRGGLTRSWQMAAPEGADHVVIDAPAGVSGQALQEMLRRTDIILIPVVPSPIDIHATTDFIRDLLLSSKGWRHDVHIGVVANRVRRETPHYEPLKRFLNSLNIPFITSLTDTENYVIAAESGLGIHEMDERETRLERDQWFPLVKWLAYPSREPSRDEIRPRFNVISGGGGQ